VKRPHVPCTETSRRPARLLLLLRILHLLKRDSIVILDGMNYIKGWRYQLWCEAKAAQTTCLSALGCRISFCRFRSHTTQHVVCAAFASHHSWYPRRPQGNGSKDNGFADLQAPRYPRIRPRRDYRGHRGGLPTWRRTGRPVSRREPISDLSALGCRISFCRFRSHTGFADLQAPRYPRIRPRRDYRGHRGGLPT
jgi:hypothetical protein